MQPQLTHACKGFGLTPSIHGNALNHQRLPTFERRRFPERGMSVGEVLLTLGSEGRSDQNDVHLRCCFMQRRWWHEKVAVAIGGSYSEMLA